MQRRLTVLTLVAALAAALGLLPLAPAVRADHSATSIVWDDFQAGFNATGPGAKWFYFNAGPFVGDDGIATTSGAGLRVRASGTNPRSGLPAFTKTLGQEQENGGIPGGVDHVKWLVYANHRSSSGVPGFDAVPGKEVACEARFGGQAFGTREHPFRSHVRNAEDDLRLASVALNTLDFESFLVFDFFLTNQRVYAFYERLPFGRTPDHNYAAFSYGIPVAPRTPGVDHQLAIALDTSAGVVRWLLDGREVFRVGNLGKRLPDRPFRQFLTIDHGGTEELVAPRQLACGMGMFTLLDGYRPSKNGLVRLSSAANFYFNPDTGAPATFVDEASVPSNRLWGQGAELRVQRYAVTYRDIGRPP